MYCRAPACAGAKVFVWEPFDMPRVYPRQSRDVDAAEEEAIDALIGAVDASDDDESVSAAAAPRDEVRGAAPNATHSGGFGDGQAAGDSEEEGEEEGEEEHEAEHEPVDPVQGSECAGGGGSEEPPCNAPLPAAPQPPSFLPERHAELSIQAQNIKDNMAAHSGVKNTYSSYWKLYGEWHQARFAQPAPTCPWTGLLWMDVHTSSEFMSWMAMAGKTASQV